MFWLCGQQHSDGQIDVTQKRSNASILARHESEVWASLGIVASDGSSRTGQTGKLFLFVFSRVLFKKKT